MNSNHWSEGNSKKDRKKEEKWSLEKKAFDTIL
jgi:hypothetical protein